MPDIHKLETPRNLTQADLARRLRLSTCTVSKILSRSFDGFTYSKRTIARVERLARELGYRLNVHARSLRTRRSQMVGLVLPTAQQSFFGTLTEYLEVELRKAQYEVIVAHSRENAATEESLVRSLAARGVDGLLWAPVGSSVRLDALGVDPAFPVVLLDRPGCSPTLPLVATDNLAATRTLGLRMRELGHRTVVALSAPRRDRSMAERVEGLRSVFRSGLQVLSMANDSAVAHQAVLGLRKRRRGLTGLVSLAESLSLGAVAGLRDLAWDVPRQVSFAAFDDFPLSTHWTPPITLVRQDVPGIARRAVEILLARMRHPQPGSAPVARIPAILEWRQSVAPPA